MKSILQKFLGKEEQKPLINPNGRPRIGLNLKIIKMMHESGMSNRQIAKKLGVSEKTIRNRLKEIYSED